MRTEKHNEGKNIEIVTSQDMKYKMGGMSGED